MLNHARAAWGVLYDEDNESSMSFLTESDERYWLRRGANGGLFNERNVPFKEEAGSERLFKLWKRGARKEDDMRITSRQRKGIYIDGVQKKGSFRIENNRCDIFIKSVQLHLVFETLCDVEDDPILRNVAHRYRFINILGKGGFGIVYKGIWMRRKRFCAIKIEQRQKRKLKKEYNIAAKLQHPNIIEVLDFQEEGSSQYLVFELAWGGSLHSRIKFGDKLSEDEAKHAFMQVFSGLNYMHSLGAMHRDIKPENIVFMDDSDLPVVKIIDFGVSCFEATATDLDKAVGAYRFLAPELLKRYDEEGKSLSKVEYTNKVDVWSAGASMFLALTGKMPFTYDRDLFVYRQTMLKNDMNKNTDAYHRLSSKTKKILQACLTIEDHKRPSFAQLLHSKWAHSSRSF